MENEVEKVKSRKCGICRTTLYGAAAEHKYCKECAEWVETNKKRKERMQYKGPSLTEIMHEATKEGLQYAAYCKKHGLK